MKWNVFFTLLGLLYFGQSFGQFDSVIVQISIFDFDTKEELKDFKIIVHSVDGKEIKYFNTYTFGNFNLPYGDEYWITIEKENYLESKTYITLSRNMMYEIKLNFLLINGFRPKRE